MSDNKNSHNVGYGKPPKRSQFKPGVSGNPRGRPKGSKNRKIIKSGTNYLTDLVLEQAEKMIDVNEGGKRTKMSMIEAALKAIGVNAIKGKHGSQKLFFDILSRAAAEKENRWARRLEAALQFKEQAGSIYEERDRLEAEGYDVGPAPTIIHPDEIIIDKETGEVTYISPLSKEEEDVVLKIEDQKKEANRLMAHAILLLTSSTDEKEKSELISKLEVLKVDYAALCRIVPDPPPEYYEELERTGMNL